MFPSQQAVLEVERILGNYFFNAEFPQGIMDEFSSNEKFADALARTACDTYEFGNKTSGTMKTFGICSPFEAARDLITGLTARASNNRPEEEKAEDEQCIKEILSSYIDISDIAMVDIFLTAMIYPLCKYDLFPDGYFGDITFYDNGFEYDWEL